MIWGHSEVGSKGFLWWRFLCCGSAKHGTFISWREGEINLQTNLISKHNCNIILQDSMMSLRRRDKEYSGLPFLANAAFLPKHLFTVFIMSTIHQLMTHG